MRVWFAAFRLQRLLIGAGAIVLAGTLIAAGIAAGATRQRALLGWLIAIDAGHGGHDHGAWFPRAAVVEKEITLDMSVLVGKELAAAGAGVVLIRDDDTFVQLSERARRANMTNARMFISIHVNRYPADPRCCGAQTFYQQGSEAGKRLALLVQEQLLRIDPENDRQAVPADYKVLREAQMPAVLVEIGFATNSRDRRLIMDENYRHSLARAIVTAVLAYSRQ